MKSIVQRGGLVISAVLLLGIAAVGLYAGSVFVVDALANLSFGPSDVLEFHPDRHKFYQSPSIPLLRHFS